MSYRRWQLAILSGPLLALVTAAPAHARVAFRSAAPAIGCRLPVQAGKSALTIKDRTPDVKDQMQWKWLTGEATVAADFGDPVASSDYALCVYDGSGELLVEALVPYGGSCAGRPCWKGIGNPAGSKGFKFGGDGAISSGITRILLRPGESGTAKIIVKGKRDALPLPALPLAVPVSVQLLGNGSCWSAVYSSAGVRRNDDEQFNGRSD